MTKLVLLLAGLIIAVPVNGSEPLSMRLTPNVALAPAVLTVRTVIVTDTENRALEIAVDSGDFRRSSVVPLAGASASSVNIMEYKNLPAGKYEVTGQLIRANGTHATVSRIFRVAPAPGSPR